MNLRLCSMDRVVSMEEINDYLETRGRWNGRRFELASTPAKKIALLRSLAATWLIRAGWASLALLAAQPVTVALVLGVSLLAHALPAMYPDWVRIVAAGAGQAEDRTTGPGHAILSAPLVCWGGALLLRRRSCHFHVEREEVSDMDRISFIEPLIADGLLGSPEALLIHDEAACGPETFCVPLLTLAEELPCGEDPKERHLIRAAAQCLLIESACQTPVDIGLLRFRNRSVPFAMTEYARKRTRETLAEIRRLQIVN